MTPDDIRPATPDDIAWVATHAKDRILAGALALGPTRSLAALWAAYQTAWPHGATKILAEDWQYAADRKARGL